MGAGTELALSDFFGGRTTESHPLVGVVQALLIDFVVKNIKKISCEYYYIIDPYGTFHTYTIRTSGERKLVSFLIPDISSLFACQSRSVIYGTCTAQALWKLSPLVRELI
jgi:hypothetical protein